MALLEVGDLAGGLLGACHKAFQEHLVFLCPFADGKLAEEKFMSLFDAGLQELVVMTAKMYLSSLPLTIELPSLLPCLEMICVSRDLKGSGSVLHGLRRLVQEVDARCCRTPPPPP